MLTAMPPLTPDVVLPVLTVMLPLSPLEPELAVAIVMEPESSAVPTPLVTLTAPPSNPPDPPLICTSPPFLRWPMMPRQR